jgi:hypothetical protein
MPLLVRFHAVLFAVRKALRFPRAAAGPACGLPVKATISICSLSEFGDPILLSDPTNEPGTPGERGRVRENGETMPRSAVPAVRWDRREADMTLPILFRLQVGAPTVRWARSNTLAIMRREMGGCAASARGKMCARQTDPGELMDTLGDTSRFPGRTFDLSGRNQAHLR